MQTADYKFKSANSMLQVQKCKQQAASSKVQTAGYTFKGANSSQDMQNIASVNHFKVNNKANDRAQTTVC